MKILKISSQTNLDSCLPLAVSILKKGGVVAYPTDTCYGLAADSLNEKAIKKVYAIKSRDFRKPLSILVASPLSIGKYAKLNPDARKLIKKFLPGPLTLVLKKKAKLPTVLTNFESTIAVRFVRQRAAIFLAARLGRPITATSANIAGQPEIYSGRRLASIFARRRARPDLIIDAGTLPKVKPSTMVDLSSKPYRILRRGPVSVSALKKILRAELIVS